jgi:hypothetical protein
VGYGNLAPSPFLGGGVNVPVPKGASGWQEELQKLVLSFGRLFRRGELQGSFASFFLPLYTVRVSQIAFGLLLLTAF